MPVEEQFVSPSRLDYFRKHYAVRPSPTPRTPLFFFFFSIISLQLSFTFQSIVLGRATTCIMLCTPDHITRPYSCLEVMCTSANRVGSHDARELLVHHYSFPQISNLISKTTKKKTSRLLPPARQPAPLPAYTLT